MCLLAFIAGGASSQAPDFSLMFGALVLFLNLMILLFLPWALFVFFLKRILAWMDRRGWISYHADVPTYGSLGNAFMEIQALAQPEKTYVLELKEAQKQEKRDDDDAGGPSPSAIRRRQNEADPQANRE